MEEAGAPTRIAFRDEGKCKTREMHVKTSVSNVMKTGHAWSDQRDARALRVEGEGSGTIAISPIRTYDK